MKKIFFPLLAFMLYLAPANAQEESNLVVSAGPVKHLSFGNKMKVILIKASPDQTAVSFNKEAFEKLDVHVNNNSLHIDPRHVSKNDVVYVMVHDLQSITLGPNTAISNEGLGLNGNIDLYVSDGASARLKTSGEVKAYPLGESAVDVKVKPLPLNASAKVF